MGEATASLNRQRPHPKLRCKFKRLGETEMPTASQYKAVTGTIIRALERGTVPWKKPWNAPRGLYGLPHNASSGRRYRGMNLITLWASAINQGFESQGWLTGRNVGELGGSVLPDQKKKATLVYFNKQLIREDKDEKTGEIKEKSIWYMKFFYLYNTEQCTELTLPARETASLEGLKFDPISEAENIVARYLNPFDMHLKLSHTGGDQAFYIPKTDQICMPRKEWFVNAEEYYSTLFHEFGHSTGSSNPKRLERFDASAKMAPFGSAVYSQEELVAELTSAFLTTEAGIESTVDNSAAYIQGWLSVLKGDPSIVYKAARNAKKATEYILATQEKGR